MATPKLDSIMLQFRRDIGDNYENTDGSVITTADKNGNIYSSAELEDLVYRAIDEFQGRLANEGKGLPGRFLSKAMPEYVARAALSSGSVSGTENTFSLPADYAYWISAIYDDKRAYQITRDEWDSLIEGENTERKSSPHFTVEGGDIVFLRTSPVPDAGDTATFTYIKRQVDVTQGGATDIDLNLRFQAHILTLMSIIYHRDLGVADS